MLIKRVRTKYALSALVAIIVIGAGIGVPHLVAAYARGDLRERLLYHRPLRCDGPLEPVIVKADRIVVRDGGFDCCGQVDRNKVLFTVTDPSEVKQVLEHLQFESAPIMNSKLESCLCCGEPGIDWYRGNKRIALTAVQHGHAIRWNGFSTARILGIQVGYGDGQLTRESSDWFVDWLSKHGVTGPKREAEMEWEARAKIAARQAQRTAALANSKTDATTRPSKP